VKPSVGNLNFYELFKVYRFDRAVLFEQSQGRAQHTALLVRVIWTTESCAAIQAGDRDPWW